MSKFLRLVFMLMVSLVIGGYAFTGEAAPKKVAVMPFQNVSGSNTRRVAEIMTDQVTVALANSGTYTVLERTQLAHVIKEMNFQWSGMVDPSQAIEFGRMSGTDYTIVGKVLMANVFQNSASGLYKNVLGGRNPFSGFIAKYKGKVTLDVRFIDNTTGELRFAKTIEGSKSGNDRTSCLNDACREAAENVLAEIQRMNPFTGTIIDSEAGTVYIDKGLDAGIRKGEILVVFTEGRPIRLPDGQIVAVKTNEVGKIKVTEVNSNYSIGKVVSGGDNVVKNAKVKRGN